MSENPQDSPTDEPDWLLAKRGLTLVINNNGTEAKEFFLKYPDSLPIFAGYSYAVFMEALMTCEHDKLNQAISVLKELEKKCCSDNNWLKIVKSKVFNSTEVENVAANLETQIILADSMICQSVLSFMQQDIGSFLKGGWMLRKSWKIYAHTYKEILRIYEEKLGEAPELPEAHPCINIVDSDTDLNTSPQTSNLSAGPNGYRLPSSYSAHFSGFPPNLPLKKSQSFHSNNNLSRSFFSHFTSLSMLFQPSREVKIIEIDRETVKRLMGAAAFGYGVFQLGVSLLPPSLFKLSSILGFSTNRQNAIACLMYARKGEDMRAPLATLTLLWYHTIVRPYYVIDGTNVQLGAKAAAELIEEIDGQYGQSALFLFFKGRVHRLNSDVSSALLSFQSAVESSGQREVKMLSLHEMGWCHLIQLEFSSAGNIFDYLRTNSRWSKAFYSYMTEVCSGCCLNPVDFTSIQHLLHNSKGTNHLDEFLLKRAKLRPHTEICAIYWRFLVYELLYLWNTLASCNGANLELIRKDCELVTSDEEPMKGLSRLILGVCCCMQRDFATGMEKFRECLEMRHELPCTNGDSHISAFTQYELGALLLKNEDTKREGKQLLQNIGRFKGYDFEARLSVRIHSVLKQA